LKHSSSLNKADPAVYAWDLPSKKVMLINISNGLENTRKSDRS